MYVMIFAGCEWDNLSWFLLPNKFLFSLAAAVPKHTRTSIKIEAINFNWNERTRKFFSHLYVFLFFGKHATIFSPLNFWSLNPPFSRHFFVFTFSITGGFKKTFHELFHTMNPKWRHKHTPLVSFKRKTLLKHFS